MPTKEQTHTLKCFTSESVVLLQFATMIAFATFLHLLSLTCRLFNPANQVGCSSVSVANSNSML